jgi:hypothetical protein
LLKVKKIYSPGQKNQCYLFCIMRKFVKCGKYFRSHAVPPYTSFTVYRIFLLRVTELHTDITEFTSICDMRDKLNLFNVNVSRALALV